MDTDLFIKKMREIYRLSNMIVKYEAQLDKLNELLNQKMNEIFAELAKEEKQKTIYISS